jgi:N-acetyltransferase
VDSEARELLEHVGGAALGARDGLAPGADELLEVRLALHARVLVDRHGPSVLSPAVTTWTAPVLEGRIVRLEPLRAEHEDALWEASRDPRPWRWLSVVQPETHEEWHAFVTQALSAARDGTEIPFATSRDGVVVGSTRFLTLRPEHRSVEIGWTWLHPSAWGTGVNVEAKLLQMQHAFDVWGCRRVEWKTDAANERSCRALAALGATFEGVHRQHMLVRDGENRDSAWYSVTDSEWPTVRARLAARLAEKQS